MMFSDMESVLGHPTNLGTGGSREQPDGTWLAWVTIDEGDLGLYGAGATEYHAIQALQCKLKSLGNTCSAAFAEAESRYQVRRKAESLEMSRKLEELADKIMRSDRDAFPDIKPKKEGDN